MERNTARCITVAKAFICWVAYRLFGRNKLFLVSVLVDIVLWALFQDACCFLHKYVDIYLEIAVWPARQLQFWGSGMDEDFLTGNYHLQCFVCCSREQLLAAICQSWVVLPWNKTLTVTFTERNNDKELVKGLGMPYRNLDGKPRTRDLVSCLL